RLNADAAGLPLQKLDAFTSRDFMGLSGFITGNLEASGAWTQLRNSNAVLRVIDASVVKNRIEARVQKNSILQLADRVIQVDVNAGIPDGAIHVAGSIDIKRSPLLNLHASGASDLRIISRLTSNVEGKGALSVDLRIRGTPSHPVYEGRVSSDNFRLRYPAWKLTLQKAKGLLWTQPDFLAVNTTGILNGSPMKCSALLPRKQNSGELHLAVAAFPVSYFSSRADLSGTIQIQADAKGTGRNWTAWTMQEMSTRMQPTSAFQTSAIPSGWVCAFIRRLESVDSIGAGM
ncbi:MAG TPA: hypothetical protein VJ521_01495, partial [Acidobacteriota bacterium]|nr:hypothetical protein [Acidobacteriota bacterium]